MKNNQKIKKSYLKKVEDVSPKVSLLKTCSKAFVVGGTICTFGQLTNNILLNFGLTKTDAGLVTSIILIFLGAFLTGIDVYDSIAKFGGAGSVIPITGFANAIVSSAIEFKKEGYVMGVGAKMFTIAGPVIVYGVLTSFVIGIIYYLVG